MKHCDDTKIEVWDLKQPKQKFSRQETCRMDHVSFCSNRLRTSKPQDDVKPPVTVRGSTSCWWKSADCSSTWFMLWQHVTSSQTCSGARKHIYILLIRTYRLHVWNRHDYILSNEILCRAGWKMLVYLVNRPDMELQTWFILSVEL